MQFAGARQGHYIEQVVCALFIFTGTMGDPKLTDERLRCWLDGNQPARERLCIQILALDPRFRHVRPRQPKGGPDGGFDLEADLADGTRARGAIGFRNSPSDTRADQRWVREKFDKDLRRALEAPGDFAAFAFLTNVRLTVGTRAKLLEFGRTLGPFKVDIFDREQMRLALDGPDGLAARYQFLQIPLSEAEQAAFFSRWGNELEELVTRSFAAVDERLHRLEFLHEAERQLTTLAFSIRLKCPTPIAELPHVRALLHVAKLTRDVARSGWNIGVCNNSRERNAPNCSDGPCLAGAFWLRNPAKLHGTSASTWPDPFTAVSAHGGFHDYTNPRVAARLRDLDGAFFRFFMNRALFERVEEISIYANEYLLWSAEALSLYADDPNHDVESPWLFSPDELADPWVRVSPTDHTGSINFSYRTPRRRWSASPLDMPPQILR